MAGTAHIAPGYPGAAPPVRAGTPLSAPGATCSLHSFSLRGVGEGAGQLGQLRGGRRLTFRSVSGPVAVRPDYTGMVETLPERAGRGDTGTKLTTSIVGRCGPGSEIARPRGSTTRWWRNAARRGSTPVKGWRPAPPAETAVARLEDSTARCTTTSTDSAKRRSTSRPTRASSSSASATARPSTTCCSGSASARASSSSPARWGRARRPSAGRCSRRSGRTTRRP